MHILNNKTLGETQEEFNKTYPYLKIDFYLKPVTGFTKRSLKSSMKLAAAGLKEEGDLEISDYVTVGRLEKTFFEKFGLYVQVSRRAGNLWLETTMTDDWTLKRQNEHGKELSEPLKTTAGILKEEDFDYD